MHALVGQGREARGHVERRHRRGAERQRAHRREVSGDPHPVGHLRHPFRTHLVDHLGEHDVHRVRGGHPQWVAAASHGLGVVHGPGLPSTAVGDGPRRVPAVHRVRRDPGLEGCGQGEDLEGAARGPAAAGVDGQVVLVRPVRGVPHGHGPNRAGLGDDADQGGLGKTGAGHAVGQHLLGLAFGLGIERRVDPEAPLVQGLDPGLHGGTECGIG